MILGWRDVLQIAIKIKINNKKTGSRMIILGIKKGGSNQLALFVGCIFGIH